MACLVAFAIGATVAGVGLMLRGIFGIHVVLFTVRTGISGVG